LVGYLEGSAAARRAQAIRDTNLYAQQVMGSQLAGYALVNYAQRVAYDTWLEWDTLAASSQAQGDEPAAARYRQLRDEATRLSPMLSPTYFSPDLRMVDLARYEADVYLVEGAALTEKYLAAHQVAQSWATKSAYYLLHLTLLAVALFLFGLSLTIGRTGTRWIFAGAGGVAAVVAIVWAAVIALQPVHDLRRQGDAIDAYARGAGLAHQERWPEAAAAYDEAIAQAPDYSRALFARAKARGSLGQYEAAVADFESALVLDDTPDITMGELAFLRLGMGDFQGAIDLNRQALESDPDQLWIRFDLALSLLADNQIEAALAEYDLGMGQAADMVRTAYGQGGVPSHTLWRSLDSAVEDLQRLMRAIDTQQGLPPPETLADPPAIHRAAERAVNRLKSLILTLEYDQRPPQGELTASVGPLAFAESADDPLVEQFQPDVDSIVAMFDYQGIQAGERVITKVYVNREEDPSLRTVSTWTQTSTGSAVLPIGVGVMNLPAFVPGEYTVEVYVGDHLAQSGVFEVVAE